jgi:hypothetical protein
VPVSSMPDQRGRIRSNTFTCYVFSRFLVFNFRFQCLQGFQVLGVGGLGFGYLASLIKYFVLGSYLLFHFCFGDATRMLEQGFVLKLYDAFCVSAKNIWVALSVAS